MLPVPLDGEAEGNEKAAVLDEGEGIIGDAKDWPDFIFGIGKALEEEEG